jgi:hypothetical protein
LALYLASAIPFAILMPNDLLAESFAERIYPEANPAHLRQSAFQCGRKDSNLVDSNDLGRRKRPRVLPD